MRCGGAGLRPGLCTPGGAGLRPGLYHICNVESLGRDLICNAALRVLRQFRLFSFLTAAQVVVRARIIGFSRNVEIIGILDMGGRANFPRLYSGEFQF